MYLRCTNPTLYSRYALSYFSRQLRLLLPLSAVRILRSLAEVRTLDVPVRTVYRVHIWYYIWYYIYNIRRYILCRDNQFRYDLLYYVRIYTDWYNTVSYRYITAALNDNWLHINYLMPTKKNYDSKKCLRRAIIVASI